MKISRSIRGAIWWWGWWKKSFGFPLISLRGKMWSQTSYFWLIVINTPKFYCRVIALWLLFLVVCLDLLFCLISLWNFISVWITNHLLLIHHHLNNLSPFSLFKIRFFWSGQWCYKIFATLDEGNTLFFNWWLVNHQDLWGLLFLLYTKFN